MTEPPAPPLAHPARVGGLLFFGGSLISAVITIANPVYAHHPARVLVMCAIGGLFGAVYGFLGQRLPHLLVCLMPSIGGVTLVIGMVLDRNVVVGGEVLLVWPLLAAYMLPRWVSVFTLGAILSGFIPTAICILGVPGITPAISMSATLLVVTLVLDALRRQNARLVAALRGQALTDGLTGLANRRAFTEALAGEIARHERTGERLSLALMDVDFFKRLNDSAGHAAGDRALCDLGRLLAARVRTGDLVARVGGEEFVVLLPGCPGARAARRAEELRRQVRETAATWPHPVTVSIGVANLPDDAQDADGLLKAADEALYRAKAQGRDRVAAAGQPAPAAERYTPGPDGYLRSRDGPGRPR